MTGNHDPLVELIRRNRISTTEVADALGKAGLLDIRIRAMTPRHFAVGRVFYAPSFNGSNWYTHKFLQDINSGMIALVEGVNCGDRAIFGELVTKYTLLYRQAEAMVVLGYVRDVPDILKENYAVWAFGGTPIGCVNADKGIDEEYYERRQREFGDAIIVADDSGCVVIKKEQQTPELFKRLEEVEEKEDLWFDAIDRKKLSTFETVCLKKYLD